LRGKGYRIREIAKAMKRSKSGIGDEIKRNKVGRRYNAKKAEQKAYVRRKYARYQ